MKTITKELNLLDVEDIEQALSKYYDRGISISDVECSLVYCVPIVEGPNWMYLEFTVNDEYCDSFDLFFDDDLDGHYLDGKRLSLDEPGLPVNEIFNFDVSVFKSFDSWNDSSD